MLQEGVTCNETGSTLGGFEKPMDLATACRSSVCTLKMSFIWWLLYDRMYLHSAGLTQACTAASRAVHTRPGSGDTPQTLLLAGGTTRRAGCRGTRSLGAGRCTHSP